MNLTMFENLSIEDQWLYIIRIRHLKQHDLLSDQEIVDMFPEAYDPKDSNTKRLNYLRELKERYNIHTLYPMNYERKIRDIYNNGDVIKTISDEELRQKFVDIAAKRRKEYVQHWLNNDEGYLLSPDYYKELNNEERTKIAKRVRTLTEKAYMSSDQICEALRLTKKGIWAIKHEFNIGKTKRVTEDVYQQSIKSNKPEIEHALTWNIPAHIQKRIENDVEKYRSDPDSIQITVGMFKLLNNNEKKIIVDKVKEAHNNNMSINEVVDKLHIGHTLWSYIIKTYNLQKQTGKRTYLYTSIVNSTLEGKKNDK